MANKILITGASGEFGELTTIKLLNDGHIVVASMRDVEGRNKAQALKLKSAGAHIVEIDVTDEKSVLSGVNRAIELAKGIDVVINNAGIGCFGIQENFTDQDWQKIFNVNVFGVQRVNRAILPHFRENNRGLLIHISSLIGRMVLPFWGPYSASKWALEALAENYHVELSKYNIDSCIVEPGPYPTRFFADLMRASDQSQNKSYKQLNEVAGNFSSDLATALNSCTEQKPINVANAIADLINTPTGQRRLRTVVDKMGIGNHVEKHNNHQEQFNSQIYSDLGLDSMLKPQTLWHHYCSSRTN